MEAAVSKQAEPITFARDTVSLLNAGMERRPAEQGEVNLEQAVRDHYKHVYRFALHLTKHPEDAADLTQYAYEKLTRRHREIVDPAKVKGWLNAVVYRKFIDQKRRVVRFPEVELDEASGKHSATQEDASRRIDSAAALEALGELEDDLRAPLSLFYLEAVSYKEIARIHDLPMGTVMSRLYRGKIKLYQTLTRESS